MLADFAGPGLSAEWTAEVERRVLAAVADSGEVTGVRLGTLVPELREEIPYRVGPSYGTQQTVGARLVRALGPAPVGRRRRDRYRAEEPRAELFDRSGNIGPTVGWDGRVVGDWARRADASPVREFPAPVPPAGGVGARTGPAGAGAVRAPGWGQRRKKGRA